MEAICKAVALLVYINMTLLLRENSVMMFSKKTKLRCFLSQEHSEIPFLQTMNNCTTLIS